MPVPPWPLPLQVGAQTETELKEKKLRVEDALNATKAAVEEGIVTGGGCTLLRLSNMVDAFKATLTDDEQKVRRRTRRFQGLAPEGPGHAALTHDFDMQGLLDSRAGVKSHISNLALPVPRSSRA